MLPGESDRSHGCSRVSSLSSTESPEGSEAGNFILNPKPETAQIYQTVTIELQTQNYFSTLSLAVSLQSLLKNTASYQDCRATSVRI